MDNIKIINIWHIIDGHWVHLTQEQTDEEIKYYTNGLYEGSREVTEEGFAKAEE